MSHDHLRDTLKKQREAVDEAYPAALAQQEAYLKELQQLHDDDRASFRFACRRFGDFLTVEVERQGLKYATAINVGSCAAITLVEGGPPDLNGKIRFALSNEYAQPDPHRPPEWKRLIVKAVGPEAELIWPPFVVDPVPKEDSYWEGSYRPGGARAARDDVIQFVRVGALYVPAGVGHRVNDAILGTLAENQSPTWNVA